MTYPTDEQLDQAIQQGKDLAGPPPARELIINMQVSENGKGGTGYLARADLDDEGEKEAAILGAKAFLNDL